MHCNVVFKFDRPTNQDGDSGRSVWPWEELVVGMAVRAKWEASKMRGDGKWHDAAITAIHADTCDVLYADGMTECGVRYRFLRHGGLQVGPPPPPGDTQSTEPAAKRARGGARGRAAPPPADAPTAEATSATCNSLDVMRLCGRLLATSLLLGDGYFVDDRLPLRQRAHLGRLELCQEARPAAVAVESPQALAHRERAHGLLDGARAGRRHTSRP